MMTKRNLAKELREAVIAYITDRDGPNCAFCGGDLLEPPKLDPAWSGRPPVGGVSLDHTIPLSKGGVNRLSNLRLLHVSCNTRSYYGPIDLERQKSKRRAQWRDYHNRKTEEERERTRKLRKEKYQNSEGFREDRKQRAKEWDEANKEKKRAYMREWYRKNKDRQKAFRAENGVRAYKNYMKEMPMPDWKKVRADLEVEFQRLDMTKRQLNDELAKVSARLLQLQGKFEMAGEALGEEAKQAATKAVVDAVKDAKEKLDATDKTDD